MNLNTYTILLLLFSFQNSFAQCKPSCVINNYPFDENDIIFPFDLTTNECSLYSLAPDDLSHPYSKPSLNEDACGQVSYHYKDTYLPDAGPTCFKVLRNWVVIDCCQYNPNSIPNENGEVPGKWEHTQVIKVIDYNPPVFTACPDNLVFENVENNDGNTFIELKTLAEDCSPNLTYSYEIDLDNDGTIDKSGNTNDASGSYPNGSHKINFTVSDGCGNLSSCSFKFQIWTRKKFSPVNIDE